LNCSMLTTSLICSLGLARLTAATPQLLRYEELSTIKQRRQQTQVPSGMTSAELTTRIAASLRNCSRARSASHRRRSEQSSGLSCTYNLAFDIKRSTRSIMRVPERHNRTRKVLLALEEAYDFQSSLVRLQCLSLRIVELFEPQYDLHSLRAQHTTHVPAHILLKFYFLWCQC
jgi:hypothetical protein